MTKETSETMVKTLGRWLWSSGGLSALGLRCCQTVLAFGLLEDRVLLVDSKSVAENI